MGEHVAASVSPWMGRVEADFILVSGREALDLLHRLSTQDLRPLAQAGATALTVLTTAKGRALDWLRVVRIAEHQVLLACGAGRGEAVGQWIDRYTIMEDVRTALVTAEWSLWRAGGAVGDWTAPAVARWPEVVGDGVELLVRAPDADSMRAAARRAGVEEVDARWLEERRVLHGVPAQGHELAHEPSPLEVRLAASSVSFTKGCYIGQEVISRIDSYDKLARRLMGFEGRDELGRALAHGAGQAELMRDGRVIGRVTSLVTSLVTVPGESRLVGLAIVEVAQAQPGPALLTCGNEQREVELVDRPFWSST